MTDLLVNPSQLEVDYDKNLTELYQAITDQNWEVAMRVCRQYPVQARTWVVRHYEDDGDEDPEIMWRFLPLHSACARQPPASVVSALIRAYPDGPKCVDDQGMYPLHYACGNQAARDVIRQLLVSFPEAAKIPDPRGMLPVHYLACWGPSSVSVMDMLLVANRDVAHSRDAEGNTPLELAMEGDYPEKDAVVSALQKWFQEDRSASGRSSKSRSATKTTSRTTSRKSNSRSSYNPIAAAAASAASSNSLKPAISPDEVKRMQEEIRSLKSQVMTKERESERKLKEIEQSWKDKMEIVQSKVDRQEDELESVKEELEDAQSKMERMVEEAAKKELELGETKEKLTRSDEDLKGLRMTLGDMMEQHEGYKKKSGHMNDRLGSLSASLASMMEQQTTLTKELRASNERRQQTFHERQLRLKELMEIEKVLAEEETNLDSAMQKQTREMEAISAVIAAARD